MKKPKEKLQKLAFSGAVKEKKYPTGGEIPGPAGYRDRYYEASARLAYYKEQLNNKLKAKDTKGYTEFFKGLKGTFSDKSPEKARRDYIQNSKYNAYLSPEEIVGTLGTDAHKKYLSDIKTINEYNIAQGQQPLYGDVEGQNDPALLNYGRRFATLQITPSLSSTIVDNNTKKSRTYNREYVYDPKNDAVSYSESGDLTAIPSYLAPKKKEVAEDATAKMAAGGVAGGGGGMGAIMNAAPEVLNALMGLFENNPAAQSKEPLVNASTMRTMVTPYKNMAFGGEADSLSEEEFTQLQALAEEQGVSVEDLLEALNGGSEPDDDMDDYSDDENADYSDEDMSEEDIEFAMGGRVGGIHIKKANRGKFTAAAKEAGMGVQAYAAKVLASNTASPTLKKRANFARNAAKWKHAMGGTIKEKAYATGGKVAIEAEGNEVLQTPMGQVGKIKGASHEKGGVDLAVPKGTNIYSKRLKIDGKSMADRKLKREKTITKLAKLLEEAPTDKFLKSTMARTIENLRGEEQQDMAIQKAAKEIYDNGGKMAMGGKAYAYGDTVGDDDPYPVGYTIPPELMDLLSPQPRPISSTAHVPDPSMIVGAQIPTTRQIPIKRPAMATPPITDDGVTDNPLYTAGDFVGLAGTAAGGLLPLLNTNANARATKPNLNRFKTFGKAALDTNAAMVNTASAIHEDTDNDIATAAETARARNRGSASSLNTMRALNTATEIGSDKARLNSNNAFAKQMLSILGQRTQLENTRDAQVMAGEARRDAEDKMDIDNFFTNRGRDFETLASSVQTIGKNMNTARSNRDNQDLLALLTQNNIKIARKNGKLTIVNN